MIKLLKRDISYNSHTFASHSYPNFVHISALSDQKIRKYWITNTTSTITIPKNTGIRNNTNSQMALVQISTITHLLSTLCTDLAGTLMSSTQIIILLLLLMGCKHVPPLRFTLTHPLNRDGPRRYRSTRLWLPVNINNRLMRFSMPINAIYQHLPLIMRHHNMVSQFFKKVLLFCEIEVCIVFYNFFFYFFRALCAAIVSKLRK